jgi:hypothetical protein
MPTPTRYEPEFDADLPPSSETNTDAAERRGWRYDPFNAEYVDDDGCPVADEYGQRF